ncbi:MAG: sigma-70 family RNA polymerase sigma factor [Deltaproteobacteria bacterium]|nr:sigma-70 family RNA polymerase sigma factor [Deltaproteobacteria bacterium]
MQMPELRRALEEWHGPSFGWAMTCCGFDRALAEDVLHSAYLKVLDGRARYGGRSSFKTWLFAVIRNTAAQHRRAAWFRFWEAPLPAPRPDDAAERSEQRTRVQRALANLPPRQREVLDLVFYQGFTVDAAAQVIGVSVGSARTHYQRGKAALLSLLGEAP